MNNEILIILTFIASSFVRTFLGFGDALIAMPILAVLIGVKAAAPVVAIYSILISVVIIIRESKKVNFKANLPLTVFCLLGIPVGIQYLDVAPEQIIKIVLGTLIIIFSLFNIFKPTGTVLKSRIWLPIFGLIAGVLGGAYNTNGPPTIIYGSLSGWNMDEFRASLQGVFLPVNIVIVALHFIKGNYTAEVGSHLFYSFPFVIIAIVAGIWLSGKIPAKKYSGFLYFVLLLSGISLVLKALNIF